MRADCLSRRADALFAILAGLAVLFSAGCPQSGGAGGVTPLTVTAKLTSDCHDPRITSVSIMQFHQNSAGGWNLEVTAKVTCAGEGDQRVAAEGVTLTIPIGGDLGDITMTTGSDGAASGSSKIVKKDPKEKGRKYKVTAEVVQPDGSKTTVDVGEVTVN